MKCAEQMDTGIWSYITCIDRRRLIAADEEMGIVFAFSMFVHSGEPKVLKIKGVSGVTESPNNYGAFSQCFLSSPGERRRRSVDHHG